MSRESYSVEIAASCEAVFDIIHDYDCRLAWDSMLSEARLLGGAKAAGVGVRSRCVGTWKGAFQALETEYIRFERGRVAAVKLTNRPLLFHNFAATIKHEPLGADRSRVTYIYLFQARPKFLAPLLEPIMCARLGREVRERLRSLRDFVERTHDNRDAFGYTGFMQLPPVLHSCWPYPRCPTTRTTAVFPVIRLWGE